MKKYSLFVLLALFIIPHVALAAWWNPWSWFDGWSFSKGENTTEQYQNKDVGLAEKPNSTASSTPGLATTSVSTSDKPAKQSKIVKQKNENDSKIVIANTPIKISDEVSTSTVSGEKNTTNRDDASIKIDVRPLPQENKSNWIIPTPVCYRPEIAAAMAPQKTMGLKDANKNGLQVNMIINNCGPTSLIFDKINYTITASDYADDNLTVLKTGLLQGGVINSGASSTVGINFSGITHAGRLGVKITTIDSKANGNSVSYWELPQNFSFFVDGSF